MKSIHLFVALVMTFFSLTAAAGMRYYNDTTDLKNFDTVRCSTGLTCARSGGKVVITVGPNIASVKQNRIAATATTLTSAQCGSTVYNSGAVEVELPEASTVLGCRFTFITANASNFDIDPDAADQILIQTNAAGDSIRNATLGNAITIEAISASQWAPVAVVGTWSDNN